MPNGYWGKVLRVNLSTGAVSVDTHDWRFYRMYLGGWNLVAYTLLNELPGDADPLGPANKFIFAAGVATGAPAQTSGRSAVGAKSPLTGGFGESDVGGFWGAELKRAGWDGIIVEGVSPKPVYLWIKDDQVEIRDAAHLWGKTTGEAQTMIRQELGDDLIRVSQIGPAGEKLCLNACVVNDINHAAGRTGMGAVLGSKKLRAVAVRGSQKVTIASPDLTKDLAVWLKGKIETDGMTIRRHTLGTAGVATGLNESGGLPTRNFRDGSFEGTAKIDGAHMAETIRVDMETCFSCAIRCKPAVKVTGRYEVDPLYGGPEYETIAALGSNCGVDDLEAIAMANQLCAMYGLDTISAGVVISWAMEAFERGLLTPQDTGGLEVRFGNAPVVPKLVEMICQREGFGDFLAQGAYRCAEQLGKGSMEFVVHARRQEAPMHDPRIKHAHDLGYATSPTGADHMHNIHDAWFQTEDTIKGLHCLGVLSPLRFDDMTPAKMRMAKQVINLALSRNCMGLCSFLPANAAKLAEIISAITGWDFSVLELLEVGERAAAMAREFNRRCGQTAADDAPPARFFEPLGNGPLKGDAVKRDEFQAALALYYDMQGWDHATGAPLDWKLYALGLDWIVAQRKAGK